VVGREGVPCPLLYGLAPTGRFGNTDDRVPAHGGQQPPPPPPPPRYTAIRWQMQPVAASRYSLLSVLGSLRPWWLVEGLLVLGELITTPDPKGASRLCRLRSLLQSELLKHAATLPRWLYIDDPLAAVGVFSCCAPSRSSRHLCSRSPVREAAGAYCICCMQNGNGIFHSPSSWS
jgi:hypothetical protein